MTLDEAIIAVDHARVAVRTSEVAYREAAKAEDLARVRFWSASRLLAQLDEERSKLAANRQREPKSTP